MAKEIGTTHIKASFKNLLFLAEPLISALEDDGKIAITELLAIAPRLITIPKLVEDVKGSLAEFKNLSAAEAKEVADYFKDAFSIPNKELEAHIERGLELVAEGYECVTKTINWYTEAHAWVNDFKTLKSVA